MIKTYLKIAWRNLIRHKSFSLINIGGLSIGIAACLLISLYVNYELSYDSYHIKKDRIVRITNLMTTPEKDNVNIALTPALLASYLKHNYPEVEAAVRFEPDEAIVKVNGRVFKEDFVYKADADIFKVFTYTFLEGDAVHALNTPQNIVITKSIATKYFGIGSAMGKSIICNKHLYHVTGVLANLPDNSDLKINALLPGEFDKVKTWMDDDFSEYTYVLFKQKPNISNFESKLAAISKKYIQPELDKGGSNKYSLKFNTEPLTAIHFSTGKLGDTAKGDRQLVYIFSALAGIILLIALLNYINLSTARATERAKEVGIRKVNGAIQASLISQFLFESFFVTSIALIIGIGLMFALLPLLNSLLQIKISLSSSAGSFMLICLLVLISSALTGIYPAFVLSAFQPAKVLKGSFKLAAKGLTMRKVITVGQFVIATVMIGTAFIMNRQINYIQHRSLGYDQSQVLNIGLPDDSIAKLPLQAFNNALQRLPQVKGTSLQTGLAVDENATPKSTTKVTSNGITREIMANCFAIDDKFVPLLNMKLVKGRNFLTGMATDSKEGFLVNEAFVRRVGWRNPIGQAIEGFGHKGKVIGVLKDFHYSSMHNPIAPLIITNTSSNVMSVLVKISPASLNLVKNTWHTYFPDVPFDYSFLDGAFNNMYKKDLTSIRLFNYFTTLSIFIACLGLYGLALLMVAQRTKEIGIRKVLGAAVQQLLVLLAKDFAILIAIATVLAIPIIWLIMNKWLASYYYHISIGFGLLALPVLAILAIAMVVISYQTIKVALGNPVDSLKQE